MWSVPVVLVSPWFEVAESFCGGFVSSGVGPFADCGLDEAFCLSVGLRPVKAGAFRGDAKFAAGIAEEICNEAWAVIGEHAPGGDAEALEVSGGLAQEVG